MSHTNIKVYALKLKVPLIVFIAFWTIAVVLWQINGNIFFLFNFGYIGTAVGLGIGLYTLLPKKQKPSGRRFAQLLIGIYMLCFLGLLERKVVVKDIANEIRRIVDQNSGRLAHLKPDEVSSKETPDNWSKKEILGHLIDSAANNHQRFVRACHNVAANFPTYSQNDWVRIQQYNESDWGVLVKLWSAYNRHLSHIVERIPQNAISSPCNIGKDNPVTLEFVVQDYLQHLRHHLKDILAKQA